MFRDWEAPFAQKDANQTSDQGWHFPFRRRSIEFPAMDLPFAQIDDVHQRYVQKYQIVKKRRVCKRTVEITQIMMGEVLGPLVRSVLKSKPELSKIRVPTDEEWDEFWNHRRGRRNLSNAERVARGVPALGPTFVKLAQILATRPDILPVPLAEELGSLQDRVTPFDNLTAKRITRADIKTAMRRKGFWSEYIQTKDDLDQFMKSLSKEPIATASVAQVYKGNLPRYGPVAVKVMRPGIRGKVEKDATLFHSIATWVEKWNNNTLNWPLPKQVKSEPPLGNLQLVTTVDEFTARVLEDMDFIREAENMRLFAQMYSSRTGSSPTVKVTVPEVISELCSERILTMEWIEGTKLTDVRGSDCINEKEAKENLDLVVKAIEMTVSQLIDHGLLHGDPHAGNLLKVKRDGKTELGYLDFGLVSAVPQRFRDGIVIAVVQFVFARNIEAVADLCVDLGLLEPGTMLDPKERERFLQALENAIDQVLVWPKDKKGYSTAVPSVRFENVLPAITPLIQGFPFSVPPYFLNNARALATLEGIALKLDPDFNVLRVIYPYSINRMMRNPSVSKKVQETFVEICRSPNTKLMSPKRVRMLLTDWALWTGYRKRRIFWDLLTSAGGRRVAPAILYNWYLNRLRNLKLLGMYIQRSFARASRKVSQMAPSLFGGREMAALTSGSNNT